MENMPTVLVVDDEPMITTLLVQMLQKAGYSGLAASGGREALDACRNSPSPVELAIVDCVMPEQNGAEVAQTLKELRPGIRIVMMSGYSANDVALNKIVCEGHGFLRKPFRYDSAVRAVEDAFRRPVFPG